MGLGIPGDDRPGARANWIGRRRRARAGRRLPAWHGGAGLDQGDQRLRLPDPAWRAACGSARRHGLHRRVHPVRRRVHHHDHPRPRDAIDAGHRCGHPAADRDHDRERRQRQHPGPGHLRQDRQHPSGARPGLVAGRRGDCGHHRALRCDPPCRHRAGRLGGAAHDPRSGPGIRDARPRSGLARSARPVERATPRADHRRGGRHPDRDAHPDRRGVDRPRRWFSRRPSCRSSGRSSDAGGDADRRRPQRPRASSSPSSWS